MKTLIAILHHNSDMSAWLRQRLESQGYQVEEANLEHVRRGKVDLVDFVQRNNPTTIVYDLAPPFVSAWNFYRLIRTNTTFAERKVVLTSSNPAAFQESRASQDSGSSQGQGQSQSAESVTPVCQLTGDNDELEEILDSTRSGRSSTERDRDRQDESRIRRAV